MVLLLGLDSYGSTDLRASDTFATRSSCCVTCAKFILWTSSTPLKLFLSLLSQTSGTRCSEYRLATLNADVFDGLLLVAARYVVDDDKFMQATLSGAPKWWRENKKKTQQDMMRDTCTAGNCRSANTRSSQCLTITSGVVTGAPEHGALVRASADIGLPVRKVVCYRWRLRSRWRCNREEGTLSIDFVKATVKSLHHEAFSAVVLPRYAVQRTARSSVQIICGVLAAAFLSVVACADFLDAGYSIPLYFARSELPLPRYRVVSPSLFQMDFVAGCI